MPVSVARATSLRPSATAVLLAGVGFLAACDDTALVFEITSPLAVPAELDGVCISVAASDATGEGGVFSRRYPLDSIPQTLTILPGGHARVIAWARGTRGGVEIARAGGSFGVEEGSVGRVRLELPSCPGGALSPRVVGEAAGLPAGARVAVAFGWRAPVLVAIAPGAAQRFAAVATTGLSVREGGLPEAPEGGAAILLAFDADDDCDDDLLVAPPAAAATIWRQDGDGAFTADDGGLAALGVLTAATAADVDGDGDLDLVVGAGGGVRLLRNDGGGRFTQDAAAFPANAASDPTVLALGDVTGDGHPDLVVGQGSAAPAERRVLVNDPAGTGSFEPAPGLLSDLAEQTRALALVDADGDGDVDLFTAGVGVPVRLYVNRGDGRLEDRSFVRLPTVAPVDATALVAADFDGDCRVDVAVTRADGSATLWRGGTEALVEEPLPASGTAVSLDDIDGDGARDLVLVGAALTWVAPR